MIKVTMHDPSIKEIAKKVCCGKAGCKFPDDCQYQKEGVRSVNPLEVTDEIIKLMVQRIKSSSFNVS